MFRRPVSTSPAPRLPGPGQGLPFPKRLHWPRPCSRRSYYYPRPRWPSHLRTILKFAPRNRLMGYVCCPRLSDGCSYWRSWQLRPASFYLRPTLSLPRSGLQRCRLYSVLPAMSRPLSKTSCPVPRLVGLGPAPFLPLYLLWPLSFPASLFHHIFQAPYPSPENIVC